MADPALAYLWAARNAEEHGVAEVATVQESAIAIGAFGGYQEEVGEPGPNGERTFTYTPLTADPPPFLAFLPEHIKLVAIKDRTPPSRCLRATTMTSVKQRRPSHWPRPG